MHKHAIVVAVVLSTAGTGWSADSEPSWPQFRGPDSTCVATSGKPPVTLNPDDPLWRAELPPGHSSPCVWGDRIFVTAYNNPQLETICVDRRNGVIIWRRPLSVEKIEPTHRIANPAAPTPMTDGKRLYVYFGSYGLISYDFDGAEQWYKRFPPPNVEFGTGTSPILAGDKVILDRDEDLDSCLIAFDKRDGKEIWRTDRSEFRRGFSTPYI